jgi:hypothetical protein
LLASQFFLSLVSQDDQYFYAAASTGNSETLSQMIREAEITPVVKGFALQRAAEMGHVEVVKRLLRERDISKQDIGEAKRNALRLKRVEVVKAINQARPGFFGSLGERIVRSFACGSSGQRRGGYANISERENSNLLR